MSSNEGNEPVENGRPVTPDQMCSICLEEITNRCHSDKCMHAFCFECLKQWSSVTASCPLCKITFTNIHHSFTDNSHESYVVPIHSANHLINLQLSFPASDIGRSRINLILDSVQRSHLTANNVDFENIPQDNSREGYLGIPFRRRVYVDDLWSRPLPDEQGQLINSDLGYFRSNPSEVLNLHGFIFREISVIRELISLFDGNIRVLPNIDNYFSSNNVVTNLILQLLTIYAIRTDSMTFVLRPYLGPYITHFCHELYNFVSSPYELDDYDRNVRYFNNSDHEVTDRRGLHLEDIVPSLRGPHPPERVVPALENHEFILLNSNNDDIPENRAQEVIDISSDSDIDVDNFPLRPSSSTPSSSSTETISDSSSEDQPSTSFGIRSSVNEPFHRTIEIDTSNENSVFNTGSSNQNMQTVSGVIKRVWKTKQNQKKRRVTNSQSNIHTVSSQSSSEDTDT